MHLHMLSEGHKRRCLGAKWRSSSPQQRPWHDVKLIAKFWSTWYGAKILHECWHAKLAFLHKTDVIYHPLILGCYTGKTALPEKMHDASTFSSDASSSASDDLRSRWAVDLQASKQSRELICFGQARFIDRVHHYDVRNSPKVTCSSLESWCQHHELPKQRLAACKQLDLLLSPGRTWLFSCWLRTQAQCSG